MKLTVHRKYRQNAYTIGDLYVNGKKFCNTLEDTDRGLMQADPIEHIRAVKVPGETAIPVGTYKVAMNIVSPKYHAVDFYKRLCGGKVPRLQDVPGFEGILIHAGNTAADTEGCVLVGQNTEKGMVTNSRATFAELYGKMKAAHDAGEEITMKIIW